MRRILLILTALLCVMAPGIAQAAGATSTVSSSAAGISTSPFSIGVPNSAATDTDTTTTSTVASSDDSSTATNGSFSGVDVLIIAAAVALVIGAGWAYVWRDSRQAARHLRTAGDVVGPDGVRRGSKAPPRSRKLSAKEKARRKRGRAPRRR